MHPAYRRQKSSRINRAAREEQSGSKRHAGRIPVAAQLHPAPGGISEKGGSSCIISPWKRIPSDGRSSHNADTFIESHLEHEYRDPLTHSKNFGLQRIDITIAEKAAELRARYNLRTPDALQIVAASATGCQAFLPNDASIKRVHDLRVIVLDDLKP